MGRAPKRSASFTDDDNTARPSRKSVPRNHRLGARSCEGCHQRKVRCDHGVPCSNCSRYGMTCVYPTRDPDAAQKTPTLRDISNCLKRLETLLSSFAESSTVTPASAVDDGGDRSRGRAKSGNQIQARPSGNFKAIETASQHPSDRPPNKSTWEILLNNSDIEPLLQDVSLGFFLMLFGFPSLYEETTQNPIKLMYDAFTRNLLA